VTGHDPVSAKCPAAYGFCQLWAGRLATAESSLLRALALNPSEPDARASVDCFAAIQAIGSMQSAYVIKPARTIHCRRRDRFFERRYQDVLPLFEGVPEGAWDTMYALACCCHLRLRDKARAWLAHSNREGGHRLPDRRRAAPYRNAQIDLSGWRTDLIGPFKSPGFSGAGKTEPPSRFTLSQTSASGQDAPGDAGQFIGRAIASTLS
jgi:hypothetical protein